MLELEDWAGVGFVNEQVCLKTAEKEVGVETRDTELCEDEVTGV